MSARRRSCAQSPPPAVEVIVQQFLATLLELKAEMAPDDPGMCKEISLNFGFTARPADRFTS